MAPEFPGSIAIHLELKAGATDAQLDLLKSYIARIGVPCKLPEEYEALLRSSNGLVGRGPRLFMILDPADDVVSNTEASPVTEFTPGILIIGSDGCGQWLGIDIRSESSSPRYLWLDPISFDYEDNLWCANSLTALFEFLV